MQRLLPLLTLALALSAATTDWAAAQVFAETFDGDDASFVFTSSTQTASVADGELTITGNGNTGLFDPFVYTLNDGTQAVSADASGNNQVFIRAKSSVVGTEVRLDLVDAAGYVTSNAGKLIVLTNDYQDFVLDYTGAYQDGGYDPNGPCAGNNPPCPVDATTISQIQLFPDPGVGEFAGTIVIDYISFGDPVSTGVSSDIFQDHFETDSALVDFVAPPFGFTASLISDTEIEFQGDGTSDAFGAFAYVFRNPTTRESIEVDFTEGANKLYVKMKASEPGTTVRFDVQDSDGFLSTQGSITKIIDTAYAVYEYNYTGVYGDLGYGGTPCNQDIAPCPVDGSRIANLIAFVDPGTGGYGGTVTFDYISVGTSLEPAGPAADLIYEDRFLDDTVSYVFNPPGYSSSEADSEWTISGDGTPGQYASLAYDFHDKATNLPINLDFTQAQNKLFIRMKSGGGSPEPVRIDVADTTGLVSTLQEITRVAEGDYATYEYNFDGASDAGYSDAPPCTAADAPCPVDLTAVSQVLIYIRAADGGFDGDLVIDYLSVGQELGPDGNTTPTGVIGLRDDFDEFSPTYLFQPNGYTASFTDGALVIDGDGSPGAYSSLVYDLHDDQGERILGDLAGSGDTLFVRARASEDVPLRIDLFDSEMYLSSLDALTRTLTTEYQEYAYAFSQYQDGGYGGTACAAGPCPVDGSRVSQLLLYVDPVNGGFDGTVEIDYIGFGRTVSSTRESDRVRALAVFPNPTSSVLNVRYAIEQPGSVQFVVSDILGREVRRLAPEQRAAGNNRGQVDLSGLPTGNYQLQVNVDGLPARAVRVVKR